MTDDIVYDCVNAECDDWLGTATLHSWHGPSPRNGHYLGESYCSFRCMAEWAKRNAE